MNLFEKLYTPLIFIAVLVGIGLGQVDIIGENAGSFIVILLAVMLYLTFLQLPFRQLLRSLTNIRFTTASLLMNFVWTPLLVWLLAALFLGNHPALFIGFLMLMVTPCTDWYLIFTKVSKGNVALSTALLPVNLFLQVVLLPVYLLLFTDVSTSIQLSLLLESIFLVVLLPFAAAMLTAFLLRKKQLMEQHSSSIQMLPTIFLSLAIAAMFASEGQLLLDNLDLVWLISIPILLFFLINFFLSQALGRLLQFPAADRISFSMTTLARNSPIALAIAASAFPDQPLIALTLIIGSLFELPVLAVISRVLLPNEKRS